MAVPMQSKGAWRPAFSVMSHYVTMMLAGDSIFVSNERVVRCYIAGRKMQLENVISVLMLTSIHLA